MNNVRNMNRTVGSVEQGSVIEPDEEFALNKSTTTKVLSHQLQILGAGTNAIANVHEARGRLIAGLDILARA